MRHALIALLLSIVLGSAAFAKDETDVRKATECIPADDLIKFFSKFNELKPEQRDTVDAIMAAQFVVDAGVLPERLFYRNQDEELTFAIKDDGSVPDIQRLAQQSKDGELCVDDPSRAGLIREEDGVSFSMDFDVKFKNASGVHTIADLKDGAKDGKSFYKKIVPGPIKLLIPKMTHMSVTYDDETVKPEIMAMKGGTIITGLTLEKFGESHMISLQELEGMEADGLSISGGSYSLEPSPSIKKMKSLGFAEDDDASEAEK